MPKLLFMTAILGKQCCVSKKIYIRCNTRRTVLGDIKNQA